MRDSQKEILEDSLLECTQKLFEADDPEVRETLTTKFREIFIRKHQQFDNNDMQDAHEFLITLMESLRVSFFFEKKKITIIRLRNRVVNHPHHPTLEKFFGIGWFETILNFLGRGGVVLREGTKMAIWDGVG